MARVPVLKYLIVVVPLIVLCFILLSLWRPSFLTGAPLVIVKGGLALFGGLLIAYLGRLVIGEK